MEMIGTLEFYLTLLIIVIFYKDINAEPKACTAEDMSKCATGQVCIDVLCGCNKEATGDEAGDGTGKGTCTVDGQLCTAKGECLECTINGVKGDGTANGTCVEGLLCKADGKCVCDPNHCKNEGTCKVDDRKPKCTCAKGFTGNTCETTVCDAKPCKNNGTCEVDEVDKEKYTCDCKMTKGFRGDECEKPSVCDAKPCKNNGTCEVDEVDKEKYTCDCKMTKGFRGDECEKPSVCDAKPCKNNGTCEVDEVDKEKYTCDCKMTKGFTGDKCENPSAPAPEDATAEPTNMTDKDTATNNPQNGSETTGGAPMPMIQGIATKILLFNLAACLQNWVKNNLQF